MLCRNIAARLQTPHQKQSLPYNCCTLVQTIKIISCEQNCKPNSQTGMFAESWQRCIPKCCMQFTPSSEHQQILATDSVDVAHQHYHMFDSPNLFIFWLYLRLAIVLCIMRRSSAAEAKWTHLCQHVSSITHEAQWRCTAGLIKSHTKIFATCSRGCT